MIRALQVFLVKLKAIIKIMFAKEWAVIIVGKRRTLTMVDLSPENSFDAVNSLVDVVNKIDEVVETELQADVNANHAKQIANGHDRS